MEDEQGVGVGVCGHSRVSSDVDVVAVIAVGVVYVSTTSLFFLMGPLLRLLVALSAAFFPLPFGMSNKASDVASGLASMATLFKNKRVD